MRAFLYFLFILFFSVVYAEKSELGPKTEGPWFTGPLLASSSQPVRKGHYNIEPYLYLMITTGNYDRDWKAIKSKTLYSTYTQPIFQFGLTEWMDFQFSPTLYYNYQQGVASWALGDVPFGIDLRLFSYTMGEVTGWTTGLKLLLRETIPIGKYRNFNPRKSGVQGSGGGSWASNIAIVWGQLAHLGGKHFLSTRLSLQYQLPSAVHVKGFNSYGGGFGTNARVYPGQNFQADLGIEFSLTQNWALALDILGIWADRTGYKGNPGVDRRGEIASIGTGSSVQYSLAPAIEYNWNDDIGIIAGSWFTIGGRNSTQFFSSVIAFNYYK